MDSIVGPTPDTDAHSTRSLPAKRAEKKHESEAETELENMPPGWDDVSPKDEDNGWAGWDKAFRESGLKK